MDINSNKGKITSAANEEINKKKEEIVKEEIVNEKPKKGRGVAIPWDEDQVDNSIFIRSGSNGKRFITNATLGIKKNNGNNIMFKF